MNRECKDAILNETPCVECFNLFKQTLLEGARAHADRSVLNLDNGETMNVVIFNY